VHDVHAVRRVGPRRGFSLAEILVAMTIVAILGALVTRILLTQGRFTDQQMALRGARAVSRQAMNILESELRMVQDSGGIDSAATDGKAIRVLVPFRFGLNCGVVGTTSIVSMLPVDSLSLTQAKYAGYGWRSQVGRYTTVLPGAPLAADSPAVTPDSLQCSGSGAGQAQIKTLTLNGRRGQVLAIKPSQALAPKGQAVYFFQRITYSFGASATYPGKIALIRSVQGGASEELMAPFDTSARFKYWTTTATASVSAPPALANIRGVDVVFSAQSSYTPIGKTSPSKSSVVASIFFRNVRAF
jgi:prepilin-type N-terminal cleavage/methylation domain-containing protein